MDWLNIIFGLVGVASLVFSIYTYYKTESKKAIEAAKTAMIQERIRNAHFAVTNALNTVDTIVQLSKKDDVTVKQLQDLARVARKQTFILGKQLEIEEKRLEGWRFGEMIESNFGKSKTLLPDSELHADEPIESTTNR